MQRKKTNFDSLDLMLLLTSPLGAVCDPSLGLYEGLLQALSQDLPEPPKPEPTPLAVSGHFFHASFKTNKKSWSSFESFVLLFFYGFFSKEYF